MTVGGVDRLTDTSKYTGAHKERFDESGKGKGIAGRENVTDNSGYVGAYKGSGTYDKGHWRLLQSIELSPWRWTIKTASTSENCLLLPSEPLSLWYNIGMFSIFLFPFTCVSLLVLHSCFQNESLLDLEGSTFYFAFLIFSLSNLSSVLAFTLIMGNCINLYLFMLYLSIILAYWFSNSYPKCSFGVYISVFNAKSQLAGWFISWHSIYPSLLWPKL